MATRSKWTLLKPATYSGRSERAEARDWRTHLRYPEIVPAGLASCALALFRCRCGKDAAEDGVDGVELAVEIEGARERSGIEEFRDARIARDAFAKTAVGLPGGHGIFLHPLIRGIAGRARLHQVAQKLP